MGKYDESEPWDDIVPIPQDEGGPNPLAAIAYTDEYSETMSYLRAIMAKNEMSDRALELTEHVITMNPAHYTVWLYRAEILKALQQDPQIELQWLDKISLKHLKNYQIWHHRQVVMSQIASLPSTELPFLSRMFAKDTKNYHVWSYRQWLVRHFSIWDAELDYVESLLRSDIRNNSAWNHRWFITFGREDGKEIPDAIFAREVEFAKMAIREAPQNQSPWNYIRGVLKKRGNGMGELKAFAEEFADLKQEDKVRSSHALDLLADIWAEEKEVKQAAKALELLAKRYDPIRKNYWDYRRSLLKPGKVEG